MSPRRTKRETRAGGPGEQIKNSNMSTETYTGNYKPSGFAIETRRGVFGVDGSREIHIDDGGAAPKIGCVAWLHDWPGSPEPKKGAVTEVETHCNGRVTVTVAF